MPSIRSVFRRFSIYGDFWQRYLHWGARHCPWFVEPVFIFGFTIIFWAVLSKARNAVAANLGALIPGSHPLVNQFRVLKVFWNFAWSMADQAHVRQGDDIITWEVVGKEYLSQLEQKKVGAILLTAHMGNYDVAAPMFAHHFSQKIHMVRSPERVQESQAFQQEHRAAEESGAFVIHYNRPGNMLGVDLARAVGEGGIVAIQGDRVLFDVTPMSVSFDDVYDWRVPCGPFTLALIARADIHPVFIIRMGYRRYRIYAVEPVMMQVQGRDKQGAMDRSAVQWSEIIRPVLQRHWRQWFVFESVFQPKA